MASKQRRLILPASVALIAAFLLFAAEQGRAQNQNRNPNPGGTAAPAPQQQQAPLAQPNPAEETPGERFGKLMQVPVSGLIPGNVKVEPGIKAMSDPQAVARGMRYFSAFNCDGCHAANGGGGMGRSLSNSVFIYGGKPENIYMTIVQGRVGMPAWGTVLPENVIWDLVAYIKSISNAPSSQWGTTFSATSPSVEQVPAGVQSTPDPWRYTQAFGKGSQTR